MKPKSKVAFAIPVLVILAGFLLYEYGFLGLREEMRTLRESESVKAATLQKYAGLASSRPVLEKKLTSLKETRKAYDARLIEGQTPSVAAAALQNSIKGVVTAKGGTVSSEQVEKPEKMDSFTVIAVTVESMVPDIRNLADILFALETQTPSLVVNELDIRVKNFRDPRELMVRFKVSGMTSGK
jgi:hypothetical protein